MALDLPVLQSFAFPREDRTRVDGGFMSAGVLWSLLAALGFGFTQTLNRKSNLLVGPYRTAFGLLVFVELVLVARITVGGDWGPLADLRPATAALFVAAALIHFMLAWTLLALSQFQIGVARTGAVTSAAPLVGAVNAAIFLAEPLTVWTLVGVVSSMLGVALVSLSRSSETGRRWVLPGYGLAVAACWGTSPMLIRRGLEDLDAPLVGLAVGLGGALVIHAVALTVTRTWTRRPFDRKAVLWMALGGFTGAVALSSQWISYGLTTIAIAITVQQLATLVVVALAPIMFGTVERPNALLLTGTAAMLGGSAIVVWAG
jgi:drug/metabolite transporter (DMT)-like permease